MFMFAQESPIGQFSDWDKYGLPGVVIFTLFLLFYFFGTAVIKRYDKIEESRSKLIDNLLKEHAQERKEWWESIEENRKKNEASLKELAKSTVEVVKDNTDAITELSKIIYSNFKS